MALDSDQLERSFSFDPEKVANLRARWSDLIGAVVRDDPGSGTIGALPLWGDLPESLYDAEGDAPDDAGENPRG